MAVNEKKKTLVVLRKGNEQTKVIEELVPEYLKAGWKKVVVTKGDRDKDGKLKKGQEDKVELVGIDEPDISALKAELAEKEKEIASLKDQLKGKTE
jgi:hypothetical protein